MSDIKLNFDNENIDKSIKTISISAVLGLLDKPFDSEAIAKKTYDKHFNDENSKYFQMTVEEIMEAWKDKGAESCRYGSLLDDYIGIKLTGNGDFELYKLDNGYDWDERLHGLCDSFDNVYDTMMKSGNVEFIDRERTVYYLVKNSMIPNPDYNPLEEQSEDNYPYIPYYIKGRFDALFRNTKTGKWIVVDWKSSGNIDKSNKYSKLLGPAMKLDACNWNTYTLQTHFYKKTLIESGYLPEGTSEDDVEVLIIHMPGHIVENTGENYEIVKQAFPFNSVFMDQIFSFAIRKNNILNK